MYLADQYRLVEVQEVETSQSRLTDNNSAPIESARARRIRENREKTNNRGKKMTVNYQNIKHEAYGQPVSRSNSPQIKRG